MSSSHTFASPAEALRALFSAFPQDRGDNAGFAATYLIAIEGYSPKAIDGAVKRIIRGEADDIDRRFLPSPAQLGNLTAQMEKLYEPVTPRQALPAPADIAPTEDSKARVKLMAKTWSKAVPDPGEQFDTWDKARASFPSSLPPSKEMVS